MTTRALLPLFALLGAMAAPIAAQPVAPPEPQYYGPQPPPQTWPIPAEAPPVVRARNGDGRRIREQVWRVGPEMVRIRPLTMAQQRWIADRVDPHLDEQMVVTISCIIDQDGNVSAICEPRGLPPSSPLYAIAGRKGSTQQPYFSTFPAVPANSRIVRRIEYVIGLDPNDRPPPWPEEVRRFDPAAASAIVALLQRRLRDAFPPSALSAGVGALVMGECRVERDRSLSCRTLSVTPDAAKPYFDGVIERIYPVGSVAETLTDSTPTPGLLFRVPVRFVMGD